jgi:predicted ATPase/DNA-binding SARP family transcriptional activator
VSGRGISLEIRLLGVPGLLLDGHSVDSLRRKNQALIYYLAAQGGQILRDRLLTFFWPDRERSAALPILRTMLHDLRINLGESFYADDRTLWLAPDVFIDTQVFSTALDSSQTSREILTEALYLYRGDFLEGFTLSGSSQFDDWTNTQRERYQLMAMNGFTRLAHLQEGQREFSTALESIRRALAFNPFQEDIQRDVMRLLYLNGDRAGVIRQYETLRKLLDEEMGIPPMPETRALYDSIINETFVPATVEEQAFFVYDGLPTDRSLLPFLGRDTEMDFLRHQMGSGKLILVEGDPGIGKTRLITELINSHIRGNASALVLHGISYELEQGLPYQPIVDALRKLLVRPDAESLIVQLSLDAIWLTELARLLPEILTHFPHISAPVPPADESRLWEALLRLFRGLSSRREVWLFLDDLHWADSSTIAWLGYLIHNLPSPSIQLVATSRAQDEQSDLLKLIHALKREDRLIQVQLSELPASALQKMAAILSQRQKDLFSGWLMKNTEGNPFFIIELVRYAFGIGLLKKDGTLDLEILNMAPAIPATIQNLLESRMLKLSERARHILDVSAIIGREFDFELVSQASMYSEEETLRAVEELQAAHLIKPLPNDKYAFDHYLTMQVALNDMSETRQHFLHRRVAEALETTCRTDLDSAAGLIDYHFKSGNLPDRAKAYAFRAGQFAANLAAWVEALAFYSQALVLEAGDEEQAQIFLAMGVAHFHKGDFSAASNDYQSAVKVAQACRDWSILEEAYLGLSLSLFPQARFTEAIEIAENLRASGPPELMICAEFIWGASLGVESAFPVESERHLRIAEQMLREQEGSFQSKVSITEIKYSLAGAFGQQGRSQDAVKQYFEVLDIMEQGKGTLDILRSIMLFNNLAYHLHLLGDPSAMAYVEKGIKLAQDSGSLSHLPYLYSTSGEISLANGDLDTAEKYFNDGLELAKQIPLPERIAGMTANLGLVAKQRGDLALARERLQDALKLVEPLHNRHLEVRILIWLAPMLPINDCHACLNRACALAEQGGLNGLLVDIEELEKSLF